MSLRRSVVRAGVAAVQRPACSAWLPLPVQRRWLDLLGGGLPVPSWAHIEPTTLGGRPAALVIADGADDSRAVLHLHGGGYTIGSSRSHRSLAAHLSRAAGAPVYVPDYRLAPEHPFPAALDDAVDAAKDLLGKGIPADRVALSGDSAGGALALAAARVLLDDTGTSVAGLGLIAPWVDPGENSLRRKDSVVTRAWSQRSRTAYAGAVALTDPRIAPLYGDLSGLPPTLIHVGGEEMLLSQELRLVDAVRAAGSPVRLRVLPGLWHVVHSHADLLPEAAAAVRELGAFLGRATRGTPDPLTP